MTNQMIGLMKLAWGQCKYDMGKLVGLYLGGWIFALTVLSFTLLNLAFNFNQTITTTAYPDLAGTQIAAVLMSLLIGVGNAIHTLAFLFIIIALFEYAYAFVRVAYEYDDCSWETVHFPGYCKRVLIDSLKKLDNMGAAGRAAKREAAKNERDDLLEAIHNLKMSAMLDEIESENSKKE